MSTVDTSTSSFPFTKRGAPAAPHTKSNEDKHDKVDWGAFGGKRHVVTTASHVPTVNKPILNPHRNTLEAYISQVVPNSETKEEKWTQSAIRKKKEEVPPEPVQKTFEEDFPTLGGPSIPKSQSANSISSTKSGSLTMAERMKQKLAEENEERLRRELEEEKKRNEERENMVDGFVIPQHININLAKKLRAIEHDIQNDTEDMYNNDYDNEGYYNHDEYNGYSHDDHENHYDDPDDF